MKALVLILLLCLAASEAAPRGRGGAGVTGNPVVLHNYVVGSGLTTSDQVQKFDVDGNVIDGGVSGITGITTQYGPSLFYMHGLSVACGAGWNNPIYQNNHCGFVVYKSTDHINWTRVGILVNPASYPCMANDYMCYIYGMIHDVPNNRYVAWVANGGASGGGVGEVYRVWFCTTPGGEADGGTCTQQANPHTTCGNDGFSGGGQIFYDDDGSVYLKCDYNRGIAIQKLNATFTDVTGGLTTFANKTTNPPDGQGEGGGMFRWVDGKYYTTVGPNCAGCPEGSPGHLWQASAPLGPYTDTGVMVNSPDAQACQAQTGVFETITTNAGRVVLAHPAQTLGPGASLNDYVGLVRDIGGYPRFQCAATTTVPGVFIAGPPAAPAGIDQSSENGYFWAGIGNLSGSTDGITTNTWYLQTFTPTASTVSKVDLTVANAGADGDLLVKLMNVNQSTYDPTTQLGSTVTIPRASISGIYTRQTATFNQAVIAGTKYGIQISGQNAAPTWFTIHVDRNNPYAGGKARVSTNGGGAWADLGSGLWDIRFREFQ